MGIKDSIFFKFFVILTTFCWVSHFTVKEVKATAKPDPVIGEVIAIGEAQMKIGRDQWIGLNTTTMPIFYKSRITTSDGQATISLANNGLIELSKKTDVYIQKEGSSVSINVNRGGLRFLFPSESNVLINTPSALVGDKEYTKVALNKNNVSLPLEGMEKAGEILVEDNGLSTINDLKGNLKVTPSGSQRAITLSQGGVARVAHSQGGVVVRVAQAKEGTATLLPPTIAPKEGFFWGWIPEKGTWEEIKLGIANTKSPAETPLEGFAWVWDENEKRWCWIKAKDGNIVVKMERFQDRLGNWYWKEVTMPLPSGIEIVDRIAVVGYVPPKAAIPMLTTKSTAVAVGVAAVAGAAVIASQGGGGGGTASPSE